MLTPHRREKCIHGQHAALMTAEGLICHCPQFADIARKCMRLQKDQQLGGIDGFFFCKAAAASSSSMSREPEYPPSARAAAAPEPCGSATGNRDLAKRAGKVFLRKILMR